MTHREARRRFGSRTARRQGTKTQVIPGGNASKKLPKYRLRRASKGKKRLAVKVRELVAKG